MICIQTISIFSSNEFILLRYCWFRHAPVGSCSERAAKQYKFLWCRLQLPIRFASISHR